MISADNTYDPVAFQAFSTVAVTLAYRADRHSDWSTALGIGGTSLAG